MLAPLFCLCPRQVEVSHPSVYKKSALIGRLLLVELKGIGLESFF